MKQHNVIILGAEDDPCDPPVQVGSDFPKSTWEAANQGHAQRPPPLNGFYILPDKLSVSDRQTFQPVTDRFLSVFLPEEIDL